MITYDSLDVTSSNGLAARLLHLIPEFAAYGGNRLLWPSLLQTQYGADSLDLLAYDPKADLDVGQWPGFPLHWGTAQEIHAANLFARSHGIEVGEDLLLHQYGTITPPFYEKGSGGVIDKTLFPKFASCFETAIDAVFDTEGNAADGLRCNYQTSLPKGYMLNGKIRAAKWRRSRLLLSFHREDEAKGESVATSVAVQKAVGGDNFAEVSSGDPAELARYVAATGIPVLDFPRYYAYRAVSQGASLRVLVGNGYCFENPDKAVGWVETHDTDGPSGIVANKLWFYLDALTVPKHSVNIYAGDYVRYGLGKYIRQMMWVATTFAFGAMQYVWADDTFLAWTRDGDGGQYGWSGGLLCGINADPINARAEWVNCSFFGPNAKLHDYLGNGPDLETNADGWVYLVIQANANSSAQNSVSYAHAGVNHAIPIRPLPVLVAGSLTDFRDF